MRHKLSSIRRLILDRSLNVLSHPRGLVATLSIDGVVHELVVGDVDNRHSLILDGHKVGVADPDVSYRELLDELTSAHRNHRTEMLGNLVAELGSEGKLYLLNPAPDS